MAVIIADYATDIYLNITRSGGNYEQNREHIS